MKFDLNPLLRLKTKVLTLVTFFVTLLPIMASATYPWERNSCRKLFAQKTFTAKEIGKLLNARFRKDVAHSWKRRLEYAVQGVNIIAPFQVREQSDLLVNGQLPPVTSIGDIVIVRKGRDDGIKEMRSALQLSEERAWIFVPSLNLWFYNTAGYATASTTGTNSVLGRTLAAEWGRVEHYHTHPWAAFHYHMQYDWAKNSFARVNVSEETFALLILGRPSNDDLMIIISRAEDEPRFRRPKFESYIVHPWGLTYYSMNIGIRRHQNGSEESIYAPLLGWTEEDFDVTRGQNHPSIALHKMIEKQLERSNEHRQSLYREMNLPEAEWPKLTVEYHEFPFDKLRD